MPRRRDRLDRDDQREHRRARLRLRRLDDHDVGPHGRGEPEGHRLRHELPELRRLPRLRQRRRLQRGSADRPPHLLGVARRSCSASRTRGSRSTRAGNITKLVNVTVHDDNGHTLLGRPVHRHAHDRPAHGHDDQRRRHRLRPRREGPLPRQRPDRRLAASRRARSGATCGVFEFQQTWDYVKLLNHSQPQPRHPHHRRRQHGNSPLIDDPRRPHPRDGARPRTRRRRRRRASPGSTFDFDIEYTFPPTLVADQNYVRRSACAGQQPVHPARRLHREPDRHDADRERERRHPLRRAREPGHDRHPDERPRPRRAMHGTIGQRARRTPTDGLVRNPISVELGPLAGASGRRLPRHRASRSTPARTRFSTSRRTAAPTRRSARPSRSRSTTSTRATTSTSSSTTEERQRRLDADARHGQPLQPGHRLLPLRLPEHVQPGARCGRRPAEPCAALPGGFPCAGSGQYYDALPARRRGSEPRADPPRVRHDDHATSTRPTTSTAVRAGDDIDICHVTTGGEEPKTCRTTQIDDSTHAITTDTPDAASTSTANTDVAWAAVEPADRARRPGHLDRRAADLHPHERRHHRHRARRRPARRPHPLDADDVTLISPQRILDAEPDADDRRHRREHHDDRRHDGGIGGIGLPDARDRSLAPGGFLEINVDVATAPAPAS